jgi:NAD(P)-dependent dehydrogenase (short-subunit alcohol dehydrogenase family)
MNRLAQKTILLTGAAGTVGAAIADAVEREGGIAIRTDVTASPGVAHVLDVTSPADWQNMIAAIEAGSGRLDGLVNAAGIAARGHIEDTDFALWRQVMAVNLDGAFLGCRAALPLLRRQGGAIVNIASVYGLVGGANVLAYSASKGGVVQLTKSVALHGANLKPPVRCNAVCPAYLEGPMVDAVADATPYPDVVRRSLAAEIPLNRFGRAAEVAELCVYLLSDESGFVTGSAIPVDGGLTAR